MISSNPVLARWLSQLSAIALAVFLAGSAHAAPSHGIAMQGEPALPADFAHLPYVNPDAPQGGEATYGVSGTFDSLNPFIIKSIRTTARGLWDPVFGNLVYESLMTRSRDEPFTLYGLLAEKVELPDDRKSITFHMNPKARFADGEALEVSDVLFTFRLMEEKGRPPYSSRMKQVERMEQTGSQTITIHFNDRVSRETPLLFAMMPILPEHAVDVETFDQSTLTPILGSGPYRVAEVRPGERIVYEKDPDYWGKDEPVNRGRHNYDTVRIDYYANGQAQFEGFKKGLFDVYSETSPSKWRTAYDFDAVSDGRVKKQVFERNLPSGMLGFVFNTRRPVFAKRNVRKALAMAFDFEWANENLFFNAYKRTSSYWQDSELSSLGIPASDGERALLAPYPDAVDPEVLEGRYEAPRTDGSGRDRRVLRQVLKILREEGYRLEAGKLLDPSGKPLEFEILIAGSAGISGQDMERLALSYTNTLAKLGITAQPRLVDDSQYQARKGSFDYDMTIASFSSSLSPGAEQRFRWGSVSQDMEGSFNFAGASDPAIDAMIDALLAARSREEFVDAVRAYDRVLISGHYVVPLYHLGEWRIAYWTRLAFPDKVPLYGPRLPTWWVKDEAQ